jgi:hypothetical protein
LTPAARRAAAAALALAAAAGSAAGPRPAGAGGPAGHGAPGAPDGAAPASPLFTADVPYTLGPETVPNGSFERVGPLWRQIRPDEGESLAVVPEGWIAGHQGGPRRLPDPGVDPETGGRSMVFLYGSGRVDLAAPPFPLAGPGVHVFSVRTRSVVNPTGRALRAVIRLLPPAADPGAADASAPSDLVVEAAIPAGPPERVWLRHAALVAVPPGFARAEIHLVKDERHADFLVDDVSLRRIEAPPREVRLEAPPGVGAWTSPVVFLGPIGLAGLEAGAASGAPIEVEARTGATPAPGPAWEPWRRVERAGPGSPAPLHLFAQGIPLFVQVRIARPAPSGEGGIGVVIRALPPASGTLTESASVLEVPDSPPVEGAPLPGVRLPDPAECADGPLQPVRALALDAARSAGDDLTRARSLAEAVRAWTPFTAPGPPPEGSLEPDPALLLADCRRETPLYCRGWEADLATAACWCLGMICRAVSASEAGGPSDAVEGIEVWLADAGRWAYVPLGFRTPARVPFTAADERAPPAASPAPAARTEAAPAPASPGPASPAPASPAPAVPSPAEAAPAPASPAPAVPSPTEAVPLPAGAPPASELAAARGVPFAVATDLTWGRRAWRVIPPPGQGAAPPAPEAPPLGRVHADLIARGAREVEVRLAHAMPTFRRYAYRFDARGAWEPLAVEPFVWRLAPGENLLEIRAENGAGGAGPAAAYRIRLHQEAAARRAPYAGLRALGGDPHVHTGLGLYRIVDPDRPVATGTPEEAFASARRNGLAWAAVTDYSSHIDDVRTVEWRRARRRLLKRPDGTETASEWEHLKAVVEAADEPGSFAAFLGVEFDGEGLSSRGGTGRKIILLPDVAADLPCSPSLNNAGDCPTLEDAHRYARTRGGVMIAAAPCPAAGDGDTDWSRHDPVVALMEIYGGVCEAGPGGLIDVTVRRGIHVGAGGGSDDRGGIAGRSDRTICWAEEAARASILDALRARRCYWSAAGHLEVLFSVNGAAMGAEAPAGEATAWSVEAVGLTAPPLGSVEILRDGAVIAEAPCRTPARCLLEGGAGGPRPGVYHAAVNAPDGSRLAVTSPIRIGSAGPGTEGAGSRAGTRRP